jgi:hypothetical protein
MTIPVLSTLPLPALTTNSIYSLGNITIGATGGTISMGGGSSGQMYTTTGGGPGWNNSTNYSIQPNNIGIGIGTDSSLQVKSQGLLEITGEKADILINGVSLKETLSCINDRLGMMCPNPKLESEWDELLELGKRYRQLEADINEKIHLWELLKKEY